MGKKLTWLLVGLAVLLMVWLAIWLNYKPKDDVLGYGYIVNPAGVTPLFSASNGSLTGAASGTVWIYNGATSAWYPLATSSLGITQVRDFSYTTNYGSTVLTPSTTIGLWLKANSFVSSTLSVSDLVVSTSVKYSSGLADLTYTGEVEDGTAATALNFGDLVVFQTVDSKWGRASATLAVSSTRKVGICVQAAAADGSATKVLLRGKVRANDAFPTFTVGVPVFMSATTGSTTVSSPTTVDYTIRIMGYGNTADELYFNPSNEWMTYAP